MNKFLDKLSNIYQNVIDWVEKDWLTLAFSIMLVVALGAVLSIATLSYILSTI